MFYVLKALPLHTLQGAQKYLLGIICNGDYRYLHIPMRDDAIAWLYTST